MLLYWCIYIYNCYIFFLDWPLDYYVVSLFVSCNSVYFKIYLVWFKYCYFFLWFPFLWNTFLHPLTFSLCGSLDLKWICCCCSVAQSCPTLCDPMDCSTPGFPVLNHLLEFAQTHVHWDGDAIQPPHPMSSPSLAFNLSQHEGLFQWVGSSRQEAKVFKFQL